MRNMKDSCVPWIGEMPEEWKLLRGKSILSLLDRPVKEDDGVITCFRDGEVTLRSKRREEGFTFSIQEDGYQGIEPGDLVVHGMDGFAGAIGISDSRGKATPVLNVMDSSEDKRYMMYQLRTMAHCGLFLALSSGIRVRSCDTNWNKLKDISYLVPSLAAQKRITDFLDVKCTEIDSILEQTKAAIEEYKMLKRSVITEAVTKGIHGERPMKDSGVEWIGEIPEKWLLPRLGWVTSKIGSGYTPRGGADVYVREGIKFLRSQNVYFEGFNLEDVAYITPEVDEEMSGTRVKEGDILFNITGGSIGRCRFVDNTLGSANVNQHVCIVRPKGIETMFLFYYLQSSSGQTQVDILQTGGNREGLSASAFKEFLVPLPSQSEQKEIAAYLDEKCSAIDSLIASKEALIGEMEAYKKSLIYEYVTGKKEVPAI